jgi:ankyrin repeat protein
MSNNLLGDTVLHRAAELNNIEMVTWCLKMKCDPLSRDKRGKLAMEKTKNEKIKILLKGGRIIMATIL